MTVKLFQGEMMNCRVCGKRKRSDPRVESNWTALEIIDPPVEIVYYCPKCWNKLMKTEAKK
jgi:hypothetical protein